MTRIWLAANGGNEQIQALMASGEIDLDRVKVGPWMGDARLVALSATHPVLLHVSDGVAWPRTDRWIVDRVRLVRRLGTPWVSVHLDLGSTFLAYRWPVVPLIPPSLSRRWAISTLRRWATRSSVRLLVENMPRWGRLGHMYLVDPAFISQVIERADCHLLLDLAHARVSAFARGQSVRDYIRQLPLERLVEIHVSGPRPATDGGHLVDVHQSLQEEDYRLLAWVLEMTRPEAVTLEYSRDRARLKEQLLRLRDLLDST